MSELNLLQVGVKLGTSLNMDKLTAGITYDNVLESNGWLYCSKNTLLYQLQNNVHVNRMKTLIMVHQYQSNHEIWVRKKKKISSLWVLL